MSARRHRDPRKTAPRPRPELWSGLRDGQPVPADLDALRDESVRRALAVRPSLYLEVPR